MIELFKEKGYNKIRWMSLNLKLSWSALSNFILSQSHLTSKKNYHWKIRKTPIANDVNNWLKIKVFLPHKPGKG